MAVGVSAAMNIRPRPTHAASADTCRNFIVGKEATVHKRPLCTLLPTSYAPGCECSAVRTVTVTLFLLAETLERKRVTNALP